MILLGSPILKNTIPRKKYQHFLQGRALTVSSVIIMNDFAYGKQDYQERLSHAAVQRLVYDKQHCGKWQQKRRMKREHNMSQY